VSEGPRHLLSETLQAYLEDALDPARRSEVEAHLGECRRCAAELEGWSLLFQDLEELPAMGPSPGFRERVLSQVPVHAPAADPEAAEAQGLWDRLRNLVTGAGRSASEHLSPERIQDLLEGAIPRRRRQGATAHLAACGACRTEVEAWKFLFQTLEALPALEPSPGFQARVMAAVDLGRSPAPVPAWKRLPAEAVAVARKLVPSPRKLIPSTKKGWALAGGAVGVPALGMASVLWAVVAHPLLTVGDLAAFVSWRATDLVGLAGGWMLGRIVDSPVLAQGWGLVELVASSPGVAVGGLLAIWSLMLGAAWVFYRNVIQPFFAMERHVR